MTLLIFIGLVIICLAPLFSCLFWRRDSSHSLSSAQAAQAIYKAQFDAIAVEKSAKRMDATHEQNAKAEIARRLLRADNAERINFKASTWRPILAVMIMLPMLSTALYLVEGEPRYFPRPAALQTSHVDSKILALTDRLEQRVKTLQVSDPDYVRGYLLLAAMLERQGKLSSALKAYRIALDARFEPLLAVHVGDLQAQLAHRVTQDGLDLYKRALAAAPKDAFWRLDVEKRIAIGEQDTSQVPQ